MINQLLQSDIDLAKRLLQDRHTDEEIVGTLVRRRIDPEKAQQVVAALRGGESVEPEVRINYELGEGLPSGHDEPARDVQPAYAEAPQRRRRKSEKSGKAKLVLWLIVFVLLVGGVLYLFLGKTNNPTGIGKGEPATPASAPAEESSADRAPPAKDQETP